MVAAAEEVFELQDNDVRKKTIRAFKQQLSNEDFEVFKDSYDSVIENEVGIMGENGLSGTRHQKIQQLRELQRTTDPKYYKQLQHQILQNQLEDPDPTTDLTDSDFDSV